MILTVLLLSFVTFWACLAAVFGASVPLSIVVGLGAVPVFIALTFVVALARFLREDRMKRRRGAARRAALRKRRGF